MVVWQAKSLLHGDLAIRVPRQRFLKSENDGEIDSRTLLRQEAIIATHVAQLGIATPEVIAVHETPLGDGIDFLAYEYIENDSDAPCEFELGELVRALHDCRPPLTPCAMQGKSLADTIAERVVRRSEAIQRISGTILPTPSLDILYELLGGTPHSGQVAMPYKASPMKSRRHPAQEAMILGRGRDRVEN